MSHLDRKWGIDMYIVMTSKKASFAEATSAIAKYVTEEQKSYPVKLLSKIEYYVRQSAHLRFVQSTIQSEEWRLR